VTPKYGRLAATTASRPARGLLRLSLALALCAPALSVFAAPVDDGAPFPIKATAAETAAPATAIKPDTTSTSPPS
jgi:hypothetical protein